MIFFPLVVTTLGCVTGAVVRPYITMLKWHMEEICIFFQLGQILEELVDVNFVAPR
jgi:uncharacterized membrane protein